jgi:hypothetical protein
MTPLASLIATNAAREIANAERVTYEVITERGNQAAGNLPAGLTRALSQIHAPTPGPNARRFRFTCAPSAA